MTHFLIILVWWFILTVGGGHCWMICLGLYMTCHCCRGILTHWWGRQTLFLSLVLQRILPVCWRDWSLHIIGCWVSGLRLVNCPVRSLSLYGGTVRVMWGCMVIAVVCWMMCMSLIWFQSSIVIRMCHRWVRRSIVGVRVIMICPVLRWDG